MLYKKMENVRVAFKILPNGTMALIGHQFVQHYMIFDIHLETIIYASFVLKEIVRIELTIAAFNDIEVK